MIEDLSAQAKEEQKPLVVLFQDEARFGRVQDPKKCWAPKKTRPLVKAQTIRQYLYAYGAVNPVDGTFVSLSLPRSDTYCMNLFLVEVASVYPDSLVVIFLDQAAWHKSKALKIPLNIRLMYIPPYSPELNPTEMAWKTTRKNFFHNTYFHSIQAVDNRLYKALSHYTNHKDILASACGFEWIVDAILSAT